MLKLLLTLLLASQVYAADNIIKPGAKDPSRAGLMYLKDATNATVPAIVAYTTDGNGNIIPIFADGGTVNAVQSGPWTTGRTWVLDYTTDSCTSHQGGIWDINDISGTISLPTGASTSALQTTGNSSLSSIDSKLNTLGQKTMSGSVPVVIASDQYTNTTPLPVSLAFEVNSGFAQGDTTQTVAATYAVRRTTYTEPTANAQRSFSSSSANDTSAGTGARTISFTYLDTTGAGPFTETVTLNGTTAVNTVATNIRFIEKIKVETVGSTGSNVGTITMFNAAGGGGGAIGTVAPTDNMTYWAHHYVPTGKVFNLLSMTVSSSQSGAANMSDYFLRFQPLTANTPEMRISNLIHQGGQDSTTHIIYRGSVTATGPGRVTAYAVEITGATITMRSSFEYIDR